VPGPPQQRRWDSAVAVTAAESQRRHWRQPARQASAGGSARLHSWPRPAGRDSRLPYWIRRVTWSPAPEPARLRTSTSTTNRRPHEDFPTAGGHRPSRPAVLGASLGLGLTMASASTSASPAVTHSASSDVQQAAARQRDRPGAVTTARDCRSKPAAAAQRAWRPKAIEAASAATWPGAANPLAAAAASSAGELAQPFRGELAQAQSPRAVPRAVPVQGPARGAARRLGLRNHPTCTIMGSATHEPREPP
jgi:hypothetical protein